MGTRHTLLALPLVAALVACTASKETSPDSAEGHEGAVVRDPGATEDINPLAHLARLMPGEWRMVAASGTSMYRTWQWGPGRHSLRSITHGTDAAGNPWRDLEVVYWHPGRKEIRMLGLSPYQRGVSEGTITADAAIVEGVFDLHQSQGHRAMGLRWVFTGPDSYHAVLLEAIPPKGLAPLAEWDFNRSTTITAIQSFPGDAPTPSAFLSDLKPLLSSALGHTWEARGQLNAGGAVRGEAARVRADDSPRAESDTRTLIQSTIEWLPYCDAIHIRSNALDSGGATDHLLDIYLFHHTGANGLRCLALSRQGGVYEGEITVLDGGSLRFDLTTHEGEQSGSLVARLDFGPEGSPRSVTLGHDAVMALSRRSVGRDDE